MTVSTALRPSFSDLLASNGVTAAWVANTAGLSHSVTYALVAADKHRAVSVTFRPESADAIANIFGVKPADVAWSLAIAAVGKASCKPDAAHSSSAAQRWGTACTSCFLPTSLVTGQCDNCN